MKYYIWCDGSCDNITEDLEEARRWVKEFLEEGYEEVYIVDIDNIVINELYS